MWAGFKPAPPTGKPRHQVSGTLERTTRSENGPKVRGTPGKQGSQQDSRISLAGRTVGEGVVEFFERAVPEEELQEGQVRKGRIARLFDRGAPTLHSAQPSALQLEAEATTVEAHLDLTGVPGGNRSREPSF